MSDDSQWLPRVVFSSDFSSSHLETFVLLSIKWMLAPDNSRLLINVKQVFGILVHTRPLKPVEYLTSEDLI